MLHKSHAFSGFSVDNLERAKEFYRDTLGLDIEENEMGLFLKTQGNNPTFVYQKDDHKPATFTIINFPVDDIDAAIDELVQKGITMQHYDLGNGAVTDDKGVLRGRSHNMGPDIAWFKDPAGNILSILQD